MRLLNRISKWGTLMISLGLAASILLLRVFGLAFIYTEIYFILAGLAMASFCAWLFSKRKYILFFFCAAVVLLYTGGLSYISLKPSPFKQQIHIYYETVDSVRKVYFRTTGNYFMSSKQYSYVEEADVWLWVFYHNKHLVDGNYPSP